MTLTQLLAAEARDPAYRPLPTRQAVMAYMRAEVIRAMNETKPA